MITALVFLDNEITLRASHKIQLILQYGNHSIVTLCKFSVSQIQTNSAIFFEATCA